MLESASLRHRWDATLRVPMFVVHFAFAPQVVVVDPQIIKQCLSRRPKVFRRPSKVLHMHTCARGSTFAHTWNAQVAFAAATVGVNGLVVAEGDEWREQRRLLTPSFSHTNIAGRFDRWLG